MADQCPFCNFDSVKSSAVLESKDFYAIPTIGQISDGGHMLVIPRNHYACLGSMDDSKFDEFESITKKVKQAVTNTYSKPILFEHGILGQSVPHAHLQIMPSDTDLFSRINSDFKMFRRFTSMRELQNLHKSKGVYLFYQNQQDEMFGFLLDSYPQYLRIVAAESIGKPKRGNWREWRADADCAKLDDKLIAETIKKLKQELNQ